MKNTTKYFKIVNPKGHNGVIYKNGINTDPLPFNPSGNCEKGGIYFASTDIFAFLDYGTDVYEVTPIGEIYENPGALKKYKAHSLDMKFISKTDDVKTIKYLVSIGADIHAEDDYALRWSAGNGYLDIVKFLISKGANIHADDDYALKWNVLFTGNLKMIKFLVDNGANIHANKDYALRHSAENGHLDVVKYLVSQGADIHAEADYALRWSYKNRRKSVVEYLESL